MDFVFKTYAELKRRCDGLSTWLCATAASNKFRSSQDDRSFLAEFELFEPRVLMSAAPTFAAPTAASTEENIPLIFSATNGRTISLTDSGVTLLTDIMTLSVNNGTLTLGSSSGLVFTTGSSTGSSSLVFSGSVANINGALNGLKFVPTSGFSGSAVMQFGVTDPNDLLSASGHTAITVIAPPVAVNDPSYAVNENQNLTVAAPGVLSNDSDYNGVALTAIQLTAPAHGSLDWNPTGLGAFTALTTGSATSEQAKWSPDGSKIVYTSNASGTYQIYSMNADGTNVVQLTSTGATNIQPAWSPDGTKIAFYSDRTGNPQTWSMNADGSGLAQLTSGNDVNGQPVWSPDGTKICFTSNHTGNYELYVMRANGTGGMTQITTLAGQNSEPSWSPDGTKIAFCSYSTGTGQIWEVNPDGTGLTRITNNSYNDTHPTWNPTSDRIAFMSDRSGTNALYVMNANGTNQVELAGSTGTEDFPNWSADGSKITINDNGQVATAKVLFDGSFKYVPNSNYVGTDSFTYQAYDGTLTSNTATATITVAQSNLAPTVATAAAATPTPDAGTTAALTVLGADDAGESNLTYTWSTTGTPPAAVTFSNNGTNSAKSSTATFTHAGTYHLLATITDSGGLTTTSAVSVVVNQTLTIIAVSPTSSSLDENQTQQFTAVAKDQFGNAMVTQPTFTWSKTSGVGSISSGGLYTAPGGAGSANVKAASGSLSGSAAITVSNAAPTVAMAADASPGTVTGTSTALSVLGADDGTEPNLTYSWSVLSKPSGAAVPSFTLNGTNTAKNTMATFSHAGTYVLESTITDVGGLSTTSSVSVTVNQTTTSIAVSPAGASVVAGGTQQYSATALDQFGMNMSSQPSFAWTASNGVIDSTGHYTAPPTSGTQTIHATSGNFGGSASVTIVGNNTAAASPSTVTTTSTTLTVTGGATSGVVYTWSVLSEPQSAATPTFSVNGSSAAQTTTATFFARGNYTFQVAIDSGSTTTQTVAVTVDQTLSSIQVAPSTSSLHEGGMQAFSAVGLDQFATPMVNQPSFSWSVSSGGGNVDGSGNFTAAGSGGAGSATVAASSGAVVGSAMITVTNAAPTVATAASAGAASVFRTSTLLSVLGADDGGESHLVYTWSTTGTPPAAVQFSANGTNAAKDTTVSFTTAGSYQFVVTVSDAEGLSVTSNVNVTVNQALTSLSLSPAAPTVIESTSQQFSAAATDQFGDSMPTPTLLWSIPSGTGYIDSTGLFTAANTPGTTTISASKGNVRATATITVPNEPPSVATVAMASPAVVTGNSTALSVVGNDDDGQANLTYTWSPTGSPPASVIFSTNGTNGARNTTAQFTAAGDYHFLVTITDDQGLSTSSTADVTVNQTVTTLTLSPTSVTVIEGASQQFSAAATDQFGNTMPTPSVAWLVHSGSGSIDNTGLYTAATTSGSTTIYATRAGVRAVARVTVPNEPPTVAIAASSTTDPVTTTSTNVSVLGADDDGESNLTYSWVAIGTPPAPVLFSANGNNIAKSSVATFNAIGTYHLQVTITDAHGASVSSEVTVTVDPVLNSVKVTPDKASVGRNQTVQFSADARDQFGALLATQPSFFWSTVGSVGSIDNSGLYTAPTAGNGLVSIVATTANVSGIDVLNLINELSASVPQSVTTEPDRPVIFAGENAISVADGDLGTASVPFSITVSATHGTVSLSGTAGLNFLNGTQGSGTLTTFVGSAADIDKALRGMAFVPDAGFAGTGSVTVTINEVGSGQSSPTYPIAVEVVAPAVSISSGASGTLSSGGASPTNVLDTKSLPPPTVTPTTYSGSVVVEAKSFSDNVIDASTAGSSAAVSHAAPAAAPAPAKAAEPAAKQPAQQPNNAPAAAPNVSVAVPDVRIESVPEQVFSFLAPKSEMAKEMDTASDKLVVDHKRKIVAGSATVASFGASAAYVLWMLRGGSLLSSLLSILPAWQSIDPLPVLDNFESRKRRKSRMNSDEESLESMVDKSNSETERDEDDAEKRATEKLAKLNSQETK